MLVDILFFLMGNGNGNGNGVNLACPDELIDGLVIFYDSFNNQLLWIYPFAWAVVIVRKIFFV